MYMHNQPVLYPSEDLTNFLILAKLNGKQNSMHARSSKFAIAMYMVT